MLHVVLLWARFAKSFLANLDVLCPGQELQPLAVAKLLQKIIEKDVDLATCSPCRLAAWLLLRLAAYPLPT